MTQDELTQDDDASDNENAKYNLFTLASASNRPFQVVVTVHKQQLMMEIDMGAAVSLHVLFLYLLNHCYNQLSYYTIHVRSYSYS